jgi:hypothetical protein
MHEVCAECKRLITASTRGTHSEKEVGHLKVGGEALDALVVA